MNGCDTVNHIDNLDEDQKIAALFPGTCVVTAGAGAGKTSVLVARYLYLVLQRQMPVRSILALTFTRKAAAELYERIYSGLSKETSSWAREQMSDFGNSHITTLDSFCAEITRQGAQTLGYASDFTIDADRSRDLALAIAHRFVAARAGASGLAEMLLSFAFADVVEKLFAEIGSELVTPLSLIQNQFAPGRGVIETYCREAYEKKSRELELALESIVSNSADLEKPHADCALAVAAAQAAIQTLPPENKDLRAISSLNLRSYGKKPAEQTIKELAKAAREIAKSLISMREYAEVLPAHWALLDRLDEYARELGEAKRSAGIMDFKDLGACAVFLLSSMKDLRQRWKSGIRSIAIDEFQDNNSLQKDLLYLLAEKETCSSDGIPSSESLEEGKLFFVGDEKQSIYKFRGADVSVFRRLAQELKANGLEDGRHRYLSLGKNYRSTQRLISFFNEFFDQVMNDKDESLMAYHEARYSPMSQGVRSSSRREDNDRAESLVRFYVMNNDAQDQYLDDDETDDDSEGLEETEYLKNDDGIAFEVARFIARSKGNIVIGNGKRAEYDDFAILLRSTTHQHRLERYLRALDIPFQSDNPKSLFKESPANDIYYVLSLLNKPWDKRAYLAVLRCPVCRISDSGFLELATASLDPFDMPQDAALSPSDIASLERAKGFYAELRLMQGNESVARIVDYVWNQGGLKIDILSRPAAHPFLEHFNYMFRLAAAIDAQGACVADFLALIEPCIEQGSETLDIDKVPRKRAAGVKIMTIHKSKGLQFPIVIIPWVENAGSSSRDHALWYRLGSALAMDIKKHDIPGAKSNNLVFEIAKEEEKAKSDAEVKRLLYVACTRAENHLLFFGKIPAKGISESSFLHYLGSFSNNTGILDTISLCPVPKDLARQKGRSAAIEPSDFMESYARRETFKATWPSRSIAATQVAIYAQTIAAVRDNGFSKAIAIDPGMRKFSLIPAIPSETFGILCHDCVEHAIMTGSAEGFAPDINFLKDYSPAAMQEAIDEAKAMASAFVASGFWSTMRMNSIVQCEKSFVLSLGKAFIEGRMDLFIERNGEIAIIDLKTDSIEEPWRYATQLDIYREAAMAFAPNASIRTGILWLRTMNLCWRSAPVSSEKLETLVAEASRCIGQDGQDSDILNADLYESNQR
jgi:ATP-dependent helicase/nuclease subunit A